MYLYLKLNKDKLHNEFFIWFAGSSWSWFSIHFYGVEVGHSLKLLLEFDGPFFERKNIAGGRNPRHGLLENVLGVSAQILACNNGIYQEEETFLQLGETEGFCERREWTVKLIPSSDVMDRIFAPLTIYAAQMYCL